ncbi:MAG: DUF72 domain-containing protein [Chloroflexota bacterium]
MTLKWHLGTMGFGYKQWIGPFYPAGMNARSFLSYYGQHFDAVEIDSTFYGTPRAEQLQKWANSTPKQFKFCLKTPRQITHEQPLPISIDEMLVFLERVQLLKDKLGAILIQFGPDFTVQYQEELDHFLSQLPKTIRYAVEFRHRSWAVEETAVLLQKHNACFVSADYIHLPKEIVQTTDFLYCRFIGPHGQYATKDKELVDLTPALNQWHQKMTPYFDKVSNIFGFFNNDFSGHSPTTCNRFRKIVGLSEQEIRPLQQGRLF